MNIVLIVLAIAAFAVIVFWVAGARAASEAAAAVAREMQNLPEIDRIFRAAEDGLIARRTKDDSRAVARLERARTLARSATVEARDEAARLYTGLVNHDAVGGIALYEAGLLFDHDSPTPDFPRAREYFVRMKQYYGRHRRYGAEMAEHRLKILAGLDAKAAASTVTSQADWLHRGRWGVPALGALGRALIWLPATLFSAIRDYVTAPYGDGRRWRVAARVLVVAAYAAAAFFLLAPFVTRDAGRLPAVSAAMIRVPSAVGVALVLTIIAIAVGLVAQAALTKMFDLSFTRRESRLGRIAEALPAAGFIVGGVTIALGFVNALFIFLHAPSSTLPNQITHLGGITIHEHAIDAAGAYSFTQPNARMVGGYLSVGDNVANVGIPTTLVFSESPGQVSDIEVTRGVLFVIADRRLWAVEHATATVVTELPVANMRFGRRVHRGGLASELLVMGSKGGRSFVYELRPGGGYYKVLDTDGAVIGAAGCGEGTAVAIDDRVVLLREGFNPRALFVLPERSAPIRSIAARLALNADEEQCVWLVATAKGVYAIQKGVAALLIAGIGGNLSISDADAFEFFLTDPARNTCVRVGITDAGGGTF